MHTGYDMLLGPGVHPFLGVDFRMSISVLRHSINAIPLVQKWFSRKAGNPASGVGCKVRCSTSKARRKKASTQRVNLSVKAKIKQGSANNVGTRSIKYPGTYGFVANAYVTARDITAKFAVFARPKVVTQKPL